LRGLKSNTRPYLERGFVAVLGEGEGAGHDPAVVHQVVKRQARV